MPRKAIPPPQVYLTVKEAAEVVGCCEATLRRWVKGGLISHIRVLRTIRIRRVDLDYAMQRLIRRSPLDDRRNVGQLYVPEQREVP